MFIACPHCRELVATDPQTRQPPSLCPRCGGTLREEPVTPTPARPAASPSFVSLLRGSPPAAGQAADATDAQTGTGNAIEPSLAAVSPDVEHNAASTGTADAADAIESLPDAEADDDASITVEATMSAAPSVSADDDETARSSVQEDIDVPSAPDDEASLTAPAVETIADVGADTDVGDETDIDSIDVHTADNAQTLPTPADASAAAAVAPAATPAPARGPSFAHRTRTMPATVSTSRWQWVAIAALSLLLLLQILLADRARLAADAGWRPWLVTLCQALRCELPPWREPAAFAMLNRDVRPLPGTPGTLQAQATFRNEARWAQPWPLLVLTLKDADGRTLGTRALAPAEYLDASVAVHEIEPGQTAQVAVRIREPSANVVAFSFDFQ